MSKTSQRLRQERAAAALEAQRKERRRQLLTVGGVLVALLVITGILYFVVARSDTSKDSAAAAAGTGSDLGLTIGPDEAPHKVVIYEDFLCPFCGDLEKRTHTELASLADAGKVQVEYRPFPFLTRAGDYSEQATEAFAVTLDQSGPEAAKSLHDLFFANQPSESGPFPSTSDIADQMKQAGADEATVQAFQDGGGARWAGEAADAAAAIDVQSTPTIVVDGKPFTGGRTIDDVADNLLAAVR